MVDSGASQKKEPYESPKVSVISLRPEEAVLGSCKSMSSAGPFGSCLSGLGCKVPGS
jgi:hypothetical protein